MSWSITKVGKAGKLAETVAESFAKTSGGYPGAETTMKNQAGVIAAEACASLPPDTVVQVTGNGSAGLENYQSYVSEGPKFNSHYFKLEITTLGKLEE